MKKKLLVGALLLLSLNIYSQNQKRLDSSYNKYFKLARKVPYLHLNKTTFLQGEEIWFKAYMLDQSSKRLDSYTSNLYCTLFDEKGMQITKKLVYLKNGKGKGNFLLDSTYKGNTYYIKASTEWMKNFKEDESFIQKINIKRTINKKAKKLKITYDTQLLPEGGHLLNDVENVIGVHIKNNNNEGVKIDSGFVLNSKGKRIHSFSTNIFGMGKFRLLYKKDEQYSVFIRLPNGSILRKKLPKSESTGVVMNVINPNTNYINITLKSNEETLKSIDGREFTVHIHNTKSYLSRKIHFKKGKGVYSFLISNKKLSSGVNIVTLFNQENKPVSERIVFIYKSSMFPKISISAAKTTTDSLSIKVKKADTETHFLSASFLPEATKAYKPENNIYSKFLLKPYIKGHIQNPSYYFNNTNRKKLAALDILLMNQGWSKFKWTNIFNSPPKPVHKIEKGITISGEINVPAKRRTGILSLISPINNLALSRDSVQKEFKFPNLFLTDTSTITLSYRTPRGREKKFTGFVQFSPTKKREVIDPKTIEIFENVEDDTQIALDNFVFERELLDEIRIRSKVVFNNKPVFGLGPLKSIKVEENYDDNTSLLDILVGNGFFHIGSALDNLFLIYERQHYNTQKANWGVDPKTAKVFLDDIDITNSTRQLYYLKADHIDEVFFNRQERGTIFIYTKKVRNTISSTKKDYTVPFGYAIEKEYYQPRYGSYTDNTFTYFGSIYWTPNITIPASEKEHFIKIPTLNQKSVRIFIEGITNEGKLISVEKVIDIK